MQRLLTHATVITMDPRRRVLHDAAVGMDGQRLTYVGPADGAPPADEVLDLSGQVVLPGLIHAHLHACQTLLRNGADGLELLDWLRERVWPFEAAHDAASMRASAELTFLELLRGGATACLDMGSVHHYGEVFAAARDAGIRLVGGKCMMDAGQATPRGLREDTASSLASSLQLLHAWHGQAEGRLRYAFAPRFVLSCTEGLLRQVAGLALEQGVRVHTHASENPTECDLVRERTGKDYLVYLAHLGLLGPRTTLAHGVWLTAEEQRLLKDTHTCLCHCPSANLKLASGVARVPELVAQGVTVGLGADGAPCNNTLDIFQELRLAALLHLPRVGPAGFTALQALELATVHGARALGLEDDIGSLEVGKKADCIVVDLRAPHATPAGDDVVGTLVYCGRATDVRHSFIDGRQVVRDGRVLTLDTPRVEDAARAQAARLQQRL